MSVFSFPRLNFAGTITLNPGTANNDDYAQAGGGQLTMPSSFGPYAGQPFGLIDSKIVQPRTFGMSDADFITWVQNPQTFDSSQGPQTAMPSEWNYYGDMSSSATASIVGVQTGAGQLYTAADPTVQLSSLVGATLSFTGGISDVNSEGSPPATQFFIDSLKLTSGGGTPIQGTPNKGACQWINFYRNVNLQADGGAGGYIYHVMLAGGGTTIDVPGWPAGVRGLVLRYYLYNTEIPVGGASALAALYAQGKTNAATLQIAGTIAPLLADEAILTGPVGRLLISNTAQIPTPQGSQNNSPNGLISLAPAVVQVDGNLVSADFIGTFPEYYQSGSNPKYDFGAVQLVVTGGGITAPIGPVPYTDQAGGNARGWVFDFDVSSNSQAQQALKDPEAAFSLTNTAYGTVLAEADYYFPSNQQAIYAEQNGPGDLFWNQGTTEPATVSVYHRGQMISSADCRPITVWAYQSTPIQSPGNVTKLSTSFKPGDPIKVDTSQPGNMLLTFTIGEGSDPPQNYATFSFPPYITNWPSISLRILPNDEDFSQYYVDPSAAEPVGNEQLTFDVLYAKVLRTYYLLFPAMNQIFPLNDEQKVTKMAPAILRVTDPSKWMQTGFMPRTRDMSASRRTLLQAWCRKVAPAPNAAAAGAVSA